MPKPSRMSCSALVELLSDYDTGALDVPTAARVRLHLLICAGCRGYLAQLRTTVAMMARLWVADLDPALRDRLVAAFRDGQ
jgi:predicted anti-sigma-YlaC factor YlaD